MPVMHQKSGIVQLQMHLNHEAHFVKDSTKASGLAAEPAAL
jgi:hypothetical protein